MQLARGVRRLVATILTFDNGLDRLYNPCDSKLLDGVHFAKPLYFS